MLASFLSTWYKLESFEERTSTKKMSPYNLSISILVISGWWDRIQPIVGGAILGLIILGSLRKQAESISQPTILSADPCSTRGHASTQNPK